MKKFIFLLLLFFTSTQSISADEPSVKINWISDNEGPVEKMNYPIGTNYDFEYQLSQHNDSTKTKLGEKSPSRIQNNKQIGHIELSACVPLIDKRAIILRFCYLYKVIGFEPSLVIDSYGDYVLSGNLVLSFGIDSDTWQISPFATIGYGRFFPYGSGMINLGCGTKCRFFKSLGIRFEYILFVGEDGAGYFGPSAGISYFLKL